ncbi:hypothetical protein ACHQM5_012502 [Ranunculus cassubicifolius]
MLKTTLSYFITPKISFLKIFRESSKNGHNPYCGTLNLYPTPTRPRGRYPFHKSTSTISCTMDMTQGESGDKNPLSFDHLKTKTKQVWESLPQPVKSFPWSEAVENFFQLVLNLIFAVTKYLSVPLLAITSLSELSYCAHERKIRLVPIPLLAGFAVAGVFRDTFLDLYPHLKEEEFPWHLVAVAAIFVLIKLPGPYYPYWGRIFIPHFANGGLLRCVWFAFISTRRQTVAKEPTVQQGAPNDHLTEEGP